VGKVSDYVLGLVRQQLGERGPVVWFDPGGVYASLPERLFAEDVPMLQYDGSFLKLRCEVEPYMDGFEPPKIVVYVALDESETHHALVELTAAGTTLRPGHPSYPCNTRLSVVARAALKDVMPAGALEGIMSKVEAGQLTLADLDRIAEQGAPDLSLLALIYGTTQPVELTLLFLTDEAKDTDLVARGAVEDLKRLLAEQYGAEAGSQNEPAVLRTWLARHLLISECLLSAEDVQLTLADVTLPSTAPQQDAVREVTRTWRNRVDFADSYQECADGIEDKLDLSSLLEKLEAIQQIETFRGSDEAVQRLVAQELLETLQLEVLDLARHRQRTFWGRQPESNARWQLIVAAGDLMFECERVAGEVKGLSDADEMIRRYTGGERPWCELDTAQRRLERLYLESEDLAVRPELEKLVAKARQQYQQEANTLSERFIGAMEQAGFAVAGTHQRMTFARLVGPRLEQGRVAYFLVDAMRYEMGRELARLLGEEVEEVSGFIASVPTITEIGMASLMPSAEGEVEVVDAGGGKLGLKVGDSLLRNRQERLGYLQQQVSIPTAVLKLDDFQPLRKSTRDSIATARLVVVTSQEIDAVGESDNASFARQTMGKVLEMITRAVRALAREGIEHFVITADHGHLFAEEVLSDMTLERPGGQEVDIHRRVWVGRGGSAVPNTVRFKPAVFGLDGDLDIVTPRTLACFAAPGGNQFFHGGISLQELIVPAIVVRARAAAAPLSEIEWKLAGPRRITTRVYSVSVSAEAAGLFSIEPPRVRVELWAAGKKVGRLQDADYGLERETGEITLRVMDDGRSVEENHLTFLLEDIGDAREAEVRLIDARTEGYLAKLEHLEVSISL